MWAGSCAARGPKTPSKLSGVSMASKECWSDRTRGWSAVPARSMTPQKTCRHRSRSRLPARSTAHRTSGTLVSRHDISVIFGYCMKGGTKLFPSRRWLSSGLYRLCAAFFFLPLATDRLPTARPADRAQSREPAHVLAADFRLPSESHSRIFRRNCRSLPPTMVINGCSQCMVSEFGIGSNGLDDR
jgi:hypothetical protein